MQIQVNTDRHISGNETRSAEVRGTLESALSRHSDHITRVEVHLSDENSPAKGGGNDIRCVLEARLEHHQPMAVRHQAATVGEAVDGAADKLMKMIDSTLGRLRDQRRKGVDPAPPDMTPPEPALPEE